MNVIPEVKAKESKEHKPRRKRRPTVGNVSAAGTHNPRQSIIPSMSSNVKGLGATGPEQDYHEKVGTLLKRYSTRFPASGFGSSKHKKKGEKEKYKNGLLAPENIPTIAESSYPHLPSSLPSATRTDTSRSADPTFSSRQPTLVSGTSSQSVQTLRSAREHDLPVLPGLDEKNYPIPVKDFQDGMFDPHRYVQTQLIDSADYQVRDYLDKLRQTQEQISKDMQRNLFNSYSQFVLISSEIKTLEQEIRSTRNMMNELSSLVVDMHISDKDSDSTAGPKDGNKEETVDMPILRRRTTRQRNNSQASTASSVVPSPVLASGPIPENREIFQSPSPKSVGNVNGKVKDGSGKSSAISEELLMELDVLIAHRRTDAAIDIITALKSNKSEEEVDPEIKERADQVFDILAYDLVSEFTPRRQVIATTNLLLRLGYDDEARTKFLQARSGIIARRVDQIRKNPEDIPFYIAQVATITFTLIKATIAIYKDCFTANAMASRIVDWTYRHVEHYASFFATNMDGIKPQSEAFLRAVALTKKQTEQLKDIGMNMDFVLRDVLEPEATAPPLPPRRTVQHSPQEHSSLPVSTDAENDSLSNRSEGV
ncbi:Cullin repeat-like-containing domain protein [Lipomyces chichibuensis]|uniref:Cullin repeat-like-containing domain protein n=1 Tax=Lipomyces chichibuensis TaxID=1546026 RepID=UPI0033431009